VEARRKGVDVGLGPTINLHRSPLGGRHFDYFSEDPVLTGDLAAAYVEGVQENGVGATPRHYVANDYETERLTASSELSERALREVYLLAFEKAIAQARAWLVMAAYNSINGVRATEHELLETRSSPSGASTAVVVSDWTAARSLAAAEASQDLVMPGPDGPWGEALVEAARHRRVAESAVDRKVLRILRPAARVGALDGLAPVQAEPVVVEDGAAFAREAAVEGTVLLVNTGILPPRPTDLHRIAVIGHNAAGLPLGLYQRGKHGPRQLLAESATNESARYDRNYRPNAPPTWRSTRSTPTASSTDYPTSCSTPSRV
jgi:beta-glucosidase